MSQVQTSISSFFNTRKRRASVDLQNKSKVLILDNADKIGQKHAIPVINEEKSLESTPPITTVDKPDVSSKNVSHTETKIRHASRNLQFDVGPSKSKSSTPSVPIRRSSRNKKATKQEDPKQMDIRNILFGATNNAGNNVVFEKLGSLSPKKRISKQKSKKLGEEKETQEAIKEFKEGSQETALEKKECLQEGKLENQIQETSIIREQEIPIMRTPTKVKPLDKNMSLDVMQNKIQTSSRISELRSRIKALQNKEKELNESQEKLAEIRKKRDVLMENEPKLKVFDKIEMEIPVSPRKAMSPSKLRTPTKLLIENTLSPKASPQRRLLYEAKEGLATPVKYSPTKAPAYQRYQALADSDGLCLPFKYRNLKEIFESVDTVVSMLFRRKEVVTFSKLKQGVQQLLRRTFTVDHLGQIKTLYPEAFKFHQEKIRIFGEARPEKYELIITPEFKETSRISERNSPHADKSSQETLISPSIMLERKKKFSNILLNIVKDEHEKFLLNLEEPIIVDKDKITRWHAEFDVEDCKDIEKAELPKAPCDENLSTAKDVLLKARELCGENLRMKKALQRLAADQSNLTSIKVEDANLARHMNSSVVDTPPPTPKLENLSLLKGIPKSLLEKVRAKQAAKALEKMTRTTESDKDAVIHARLPEIAKLLRNIFVSEKKGVLVLEHAIRKLDDSYRLKLTSNELEYHIKKLCEILPTWISIIKVKHSDYLKISKDFDMNKIIHRLEVIANEKV